MEKMRMESKDMTQVNIDKILEMFPSVGTEVADERVKGEDGKPVIRKGIDFEKLKMVLSAGSGDYKIVDDDRERYEFTWVGKQQAAIDAATPIHKTLRPYPDESKNWEDTENLYIEGDNLEVLKLLQESYLGKVKMIYIDPPYNTGNESLMYRDTYKMDNEQYESEISLIDENGYKLFINSNSRGRFHSDWCSETYRVLLLARNFLSEDGVILISIDDNESLNLKNICDELFSEKNFIGEVIRKTKTMTGDNGAGFNMQHELLFVYAKRRERCLLFGEKKDFTQYTNPDNDKNGDWCSGDPSAKSGGSSTFFEIRNPITGKVDFPPRGRYWAFSQSTFLEYINNGRIKFKETYNERERGFIFKRYKKDLSSQYNPVNSLMGIDNRFLNEKATNELMGLMQLNTFSYPKPTDFIKKMVEYTTNKDSIILDFFSGSATTAHAVMQLNAEDEGNRKFIMVQLPEVCDSKSEAAKAGYKNICEIGKERIRRAGKKIEEELMAKDGTLFDDGKKKLDTGFRVFKVDSSNMKDVYYSADEYSQESLFDMISNIKDDRTDMDLLYACLLDWGVELSLPHKVEKINGFNVHIVDSPLTDEVDLIACFDEMVSEETIREIALRKPLRVVFRDQSFKDSANKINVYEIFKAVSGDTTVKVI